MLSIAVAAALALPPAAGAFEFDNGNEDLSIRFDNTVRVNVTGRVASQDKAMIANPNFDDGDRNFDDGAMFERIDLLKKRGQWKDGDRVQGLRKTKPEV